MSLKITINEKLLKSKIPVIERDWNLWEKKTINIHRGVIEWPDTPGLSVDEIALRIRANVKAEFKPGWFRGFGFGTILHFNDAPSDFCEFCRHIDKRNKTDGVWQWSIIQFDNDKIALGIHTWLHGYLRPVYESALSQLESQGYDCHSVDAEIDPLIDKLVKIAKVCRAINSIGGIIDL